MASAHASDGASVSRFAETLPGEVLLAEFIHRSANDFAVACAEVHVAARLPSLAAARDRLELLASRLHALTSIQRILEPPHGDCIDLGDRLCELCHYHAEARFAEQSAFIRLRTCDARIGIAQGWATLMIVSELLTNAARHAFDGPGGLVDIEVTRHTDFIVCRLVDNGNGGHGTRAIRRTGSGVVAELAHAAGIGFSALDRVRGFGFELQIPLPSAVSPETGSRVTS